MELCHEDVLVLPSNCVSLNDEEMSYLEGGSFNLTLKTLYLNKTNCLNVAASIQKSGKVKGMSYTDIAVEIFAHAKALYNYKPLLSWASGLGWGAIATYLHAQAADGCALMDGGDTAVRKAFYNTVWKISK